MRFPGVVQNVFANHPIRKFVRNGTILLALTIALVSLLIGSPPVAVAQTGDPAASAMILGKVHIKKKLTGQRMRFRLYPDFKPVPPPTPEQKRDDEWQNVVIYLEPANPLSAAPVTDPENPQMAQLGETFIPHLLPVRVGATVDFPNQDPIFHNVFSLSGTRAFDLGRYPKGDSRSVTFDQPGVVPVFCHLHSDMSAIILVLETPFFTVPGPDGVYRIENVPPGAYTLVAWHVRSERVEKQLEVIAGGTLEIDITVPIEDDQVAGQ